MIVDDNGDIREIIEIILRWEGYAVMGLDSGETVKNTIRSYNPDLVLLDVMLGQHEGRELCKNLKATQDTRHVPVIMISAGQNLENVQQTYMADGALAKPFQMEALIETVASFCH